MTPRSAPPSHLPSGLGKPFKLKLKNLCSGDSRASHSTPTRASLQGHHLLPPTPPSSHVPWSCCPPHCGWVASLPGLRPPPGPQSFLSLCGKALPVDLCGHLLPCQALAEFSFPRKAVLQNPIWSRSSLIFPRVAQRLFLCGMHHGLRLCNCLCAYLSSLRLIG